MNLSDKNKLSWNWKDQIEDCVKKSAQAKEIVALTDDNHKEKVSWHDQSGKRLKTSEWVMIKWNPDSKQCLRTAI